jgi:type I restriction enzyme S subunit
MSSETVDPVAEESGNRQEFVPRRRFPEFQETSGWVQTPLRELCAPINQKVGSAKLTPVSITAGRGFVSQASKFGRDISGVQYRNYTYLRQGDFAYNKGNSLSYPQGWVCQLKEFDEAAASSAFICFRLHDDHRAAYFQALFDQNVHGRQLTSFITSGARSNGLLNIRTEDFYGVKIPLPPEIAEQHKIADCLSSLDKLIAAERDRLATLRDYKNGLMQQLFPRPERTENGEKVPAETNPRLRFTEFQNTADWEETTIGEVGAFYYGKSAPKWSLEEEATTRCVRYGELYSKFGPLITETYSRTNIPRKKLRFSKGGEILVPRVGEKPEDFGRNCSLLTLPGIAIGEMISVFETNQNALFYTFYFRHMYRKFAEVVEGQNVKNLYYTELEPLKIGRPSLPEQAKIADLLMSLEQLEKASTTRLGELRRHKSGLMQQLFPSSTGASE